MTPQQTEKLIGTDLRRAFFKAGISSANTPEATRDILIEHDNLTYCNLTFF